MTEAISTRELFFEICKFPQMYQKSRTAIKTNEKEAKNITNNLLEFSHQIFDSIDNEVKEGVMIRVSKGMTYMPYILWVAFLPDGCRVSRNMSVAICFGKNGEGVVAGVMEPKGMSQPIAPTKGRTNGKILVDVDGKKASNKYNNMFLNPKEFIRDEIDITELVSHVSESIVYLKEILKPK